MSVKIRLTRMGSKKHAMFRIVAINGDARRDGRPLELLGNYNPHTNPATVNFNAEKIQQWLDRGAELSDTVRTLLKKNAK